MLVAIELGVHAGIGEEKCLTRSERIFVRVPRGASTDAQVSYADGQSVDRMSARTEARSGFDTILVRS
jgi:hypothetical protein